MICVVVLAELPIKLMANNEIDPRQCEKLGNAKQKILL